MKPINFSLTGPATENRTLTLKWRLFVGIIGSIVGTSVLLIGINLYNWWHIQQEKKDLLKKMDWTIPFQYEQHMQEKELITQEVNKLHTIKHYPFSFYEHLQELLKQKNTTDLIKEISFTEKRFSVHIQTMSNRTAIAFFDRLANTNLFTNLELISLHREANNEVVAVIEGTIAIPMPKK